MLREKEIMEGYKVGAPIKPNESLFIENGYKSVLDEIVTAVRYISETKTYNVFIGES